MYHVSSVRNRSSIQNRGLDVSQMGAAPGIAGSTRPEAEGIFLSHELFDADFFVSMNNTGGPVDVWQVDAVDTGQLRDNGNGFYYLPGVIPVAQITLARKDLVCGRLHGR